jgi:O-antigen biosynthesis protein
MDKKFPIPFDQYQRYGLAGRIIDQLRGGRKDSFSILEVGANTHKLLKRILPDDRITFLDCELPEEVYTDADFLLGNATEMDLLDESYDVVVALDVYEHIEPERRPQFVREVTRVARLATIIAAPFRRQEVEAAEQEADQLWQELFGCSYRWLAEHRENGLPELNALRTDLDRMGINYQVIHHGDIRLWKHLIEAHFAKEYVASLRQVVAQLDAFYSERLFEADCSSKENSYRTFVVCGKGQSAPERTSYFHDAVHAADLPEEERKHVETLCAACIDIALEVKAKNEAIARLEATTAAVAQTVEKQKEQMIVLTKNALEQDAEIAELMHSLAERDARIGNLMQAVAERESVNTAILGSSSWRLTEPLRRIKQGSLRAGRRWRWRLHRMELLPFWQLEKEGRGFRSTGRDPQFHLISHRRTLPTGLCEISFYSSGKLQPFLYVNAGEGFKEEEKIPLAVEEGVFRCWIRLPPHVTALRLDPMTQPGSLVLENCTIREIGSIPAAFRALTPLLRHCAKPDYLGRVLKKTYRIAAAKGLSGLKEKFLQKALAGIDPGLDYRQWIQAYDVLYQDDRVALRRQMAKLPRHPLISIIMPTFNSEEIWLRRAIDSVLAQIYPNWELCIADDASTRKQVRKTLEEYTARDQRIKVVYRQKNGHISAASNSALELATGEFIALLDHDDEIPEHALFLVAAELAKFPDAALIYSDEDKINEHGVRFAPYFKSDWNPDLFYSHNLISHFGVYRTALVREVGGFREGFEGSQDYDLALRVIERIEPEKIRHIPRVLYHWRAISGSTALNPQQKNYAEKAARKAIQSHFDRTGAPATILPGPSGGLHRAKYTLPFDQPLVSIIIPTRDKADLLANCLRSLQQTTYKRFEVLIADNGSTCPETRRLFDEIRDHHRIIDCHFDFNFSRLNNIAAIQARGEIICFLNNDIEIVQQDWLTEMVSHALRPEVGAVGAKLLYPDGRIQHAGIILGLGPDRIASYPHHCICREDLGYFCKAGLLQNFSAVTAACMVLRKEVFAQVAGFDEQLAIAYNDVDLCLRLRQAGYRILWTPYAELCHHESASRGHEDTPQKRERFLQEAAYMREKWGERLLQDPFYNPNFSLDRSDFALAFPPRQQKFWLESAPPETVFAAQLKSFEGGMVNG